MSHHGVRLRTLLRSAALLTAGALVVPALAGCGSDDDSDAPAAAQDIAPAARAGVADGGTVHWAIDAAPGTLNAFQADADAATSRIAGAVLPVLFRLDESGRPRLNPDYLKAAEVSDDKPKQVVVYKLNPEAVWSDGRPLSAADFTAQWHALSGRNSAYWTARNAGYDRIERIEPGGGHEVRVTFSKPYADWRSLFTPLYPKQVMGSPDAFNDSARRKLKATAGPFTLAGFDADEGEVTLRRNPRWWGERAKLSKIVFRAVPREKRAAALAAGRVDLAEVSTGEAQRIARAGRDGGHAGPSGGSGEASAKASDKASAKASAATGDAPASASASVSAAKAADAATDDRGGERDGGGDGAKSGKALARYAAEQERLRHFVVRKSLEPAYTQLALNGSSGPLSDDRVRRAVARAIDRDALARLVLEPLGLPAKTVGSHLALAGQEAYTDGSGALGKQDTKQAQALLADAGWVRGGPVRDGSDEPDGTEKQARQKGSASSGEKAAGGESGPSGAADDKPGAHGPGPAPDAADGAAARSRAWTTALHTGTSGRLPEVTGAGDRPATAPHPDGEARAEAHADGRAEAGQDGAPRAGDDGAKGAYAPKGTAAPAEAAAGTLAKNGKPLTLRFVLPAGPGSEALRTVGDRIARMLERIGIRTETTKVADDSYFNDHIASGEYDLALYSWPGSAFPATDARPIFAKPVPGADGSLNVEQNYTRVGTDHIDQLFDRALTELDAGKERDLVRKADARIWAEAGSIPLYQRPQLVAVRADLANVGAFGFEDPSYEDIGFVKSGAQGAPATGASGGSSSPHARQSAREGQDGTPGASPRGTADETGDPTGDGTADEAGDAEE